MILIIEKKEKDILLMEGFKKKWANHPNFVVSHLWPNIFLEIIF